MQENKLAAAFKQNAIWLVFFIEIAIFAYFNPKFLSIPNIVNISRQVSYYGIASIGMTFVRLNNRARERCVRLPDDEYGLEHVACDSGLNPDGDINRCA